MKVMNKPILNKEDSLYICIDLQGKLMPAMHGVDELIKNTNILLKTADIYNIPVLVTEQYPKGLGGPDERIELPKNHKLFAKDYFSVFGTEDFVKEFNSLDKKNIILFGIETHVCVYYSVLHLIENGYNVCVVGDAVSSRKEENKKIALEQMRKIGANIINTEMALFWHIEGSKTENFKELSKLIK